MTVKEGATSAMKPIERYPTPIDPNLAKSTKPNPSGPAKPRAGIPLFKVFMADSAAAVVTRTLQSGYIGQGPMVDAFEQQLRSRLNHDFVVTVNSATSAEHLALHMLRKPGAGTSRDERIRGSRDAWPGVEPGDEVLTTPLTCTATNWPILANGFRIKWVDVDPETLNVDLDDLERKLTPRTKAIMLVHWGGYPVDLDRVQQICGRANDLFGFTPRVIEDCAHAFGSNYKGRPIGTHGNMCTFSFQAIKHVTTGDGGLLTLPDAQLLTRARLLRWYGIDRDSNRKDFRCEADIPEWGFKFHMNDIAASIGIENLKHADAIVGRHRANAAFYDAVLAGVPGITLPTRHSDRESAFWIYSVLVERKVDFQRAMTDRGVAVSQVHERNDIHSCVAEFRTPLPTLDRVVPRLSAIPVGWWVTDEEREYVVDCIKRGW